MSIPHSLIPTLKKNNQPGNSWDPTLKSGGPIIQIGPTRHRWMENTNGKYDCITRYKKIRSLGLYLDA